MEIRDSYFDLKRFLTDFSLIHEKSSEMIILRNYYLSYSIALGINGIAIEEITNFFGNNIYNLNNQYLSNEDNINELIKNISNEIKESNIIYERRKKQK